MTKKHDKKTTEELVYTSSFTHRKYEIYISREINEPNKFHAVFQSLRDAQPDDEVFIYINSTGGDLWTALQFLSAINKCKAKCTGVIEGECHSAASMIFLACDEYDVPEFGSMLCHNYTTGYRGKGHEVSNWHEYNIAHLSNIMTSIYENFMTPAEIKEMMAGKDFWFNGEDIVNRLEKKVKSEEKKNKATKAK